MKRFYRSVEVAEMPQGFAVTLDGRPVRTPGRRELAVPYGPLAAAVAEEWRNQGAKVRLADMPFTRFANTALDLVAAQREMVIAQVAAYAETDLLCYRATEPAELVARQRERWDPLLDWLETAHGARLVVFDGVAPGRQEDRPLLAVAAAVAAFETFPLTALHQATVAGGSVVVALALAGGRLGADEAAAVTRIDEDWQTGRWGMDAELDRRLTSVRSDIAAAAEFFRLCSGEAGP